LKFLRKTEQKEFLLISGGSNYFRNVEYHHQFPIPKIGQADMIRLMEGFIYTTALDLNMGYYHIKLDADAQKLCTIVFPWGKKYKRLPMGITSRLPGS
jgi:hypothetical protein